MDLQNRNESSSGDVGTFLADLMRQTSLLKKRTMQSLTTTEVAARLKISPRRVRALAKCGRLGRKFGHVWMITDDDVEAYLRAGPGTPGPKRKQPAGQPLKS